MKEKRSRQVLTTDKMGLVARLGIKLVRVKKRVLKPIFRRNKAGVFVPMASGFRCHLVL